MTPATQHLPLHAQYPLTAADAAGASAVMDSQHPQAAVVARLAASLKQREGEVASLRRLIGDLEATRDSLSDRLVALTAKHFQLFVLSLHFLH